MNIEDRASLRHYLSAEFVSGGFSDKRDAHTRVLEAFDRWFEMDTAQPIEPIDCVAELALSDSVVDRMSRILAVIAITVNGPELPLHRHSYHDLADKVAVLQLEVDLYRSQATQPQQSTPVQTQHGIAHSLGGFRGGFVSEHGRPPTEQEIWNHAIRSWRDLNPTSQPSTPLGGTTCAKDK